MNAIVFVCNKKKPGGLFVHRYDSMEEGEVNSQEEKQEDTDTEEDEEEVVKLKEADQGVDPKKEEIDNDDGHNGDIDVEVRSSSPPAVWSKKAV